MRPKSLKANVTLKAEHVEEAVVELADRYLRATKTGCRVVRQPTDFNVADLCEPLVEGWRDGKVGYAKGDVTLVFSSGELTPEADLIVYTPEVGERFLYSKPQTLIPSLPASTPPTASTEPVFQPDHQPVDQPIEQPIPPASGADLTHALQTISETLAHVVAKQDSLEALLNQVVTQMAAVERKLNVQPAEFETAIRQRMEQQTAEFTQQMKTALKTQQTNFTEQVQVVLEAQTARFAQLLANQISATALQFSDRLETITTQLHDIATRLDELEVVEEATDEPESEALKVPQTEAEWLNRFKSAWGTVGDYEQFLFNYRIAHAETPLFFTPDWVALCEFAWVRKLSPVLALLYDLIHAEDGIGYAGADILQQFGLHIDSQTGDRYYIYQRSGFSAYDALWQTANNPQHSWLPELERLYAMQPSRRNDIFQLFGWEQEAIDSLESVVERTYRERRTSRDPQQERREKTLRDYLILLNLNPLTPITPESIKRAYKQAMKSAHPDTGGSKEQAQKVNEAYRAVLHYYFPQVP